MNCETVNISMRLRREFSNILEINSEEMNAPSWLALIQLAVHRAGRKRRQTPSTPCIRSTVTVNSHPFTKIDK